MTDELVNWLVVALFVVEIVGVFVWRRNRYPGIMFNEWAVFLYSLLIPANFLIGALLSALLVPQSDENSLHSSNMVGLAIAGAVISIITLILTAILRWAVRTDLTKPSD